MTATGDARPLTDTATQLVATGPGTLDGWSLRAGGAALVVRFYDSPSTADLTGLMAVASAAANGSANAGRLRVHFSRGLVAQRVTGTITDGTATVA